MEARRALSFAESSEDDCVFWALFFLCISLNLFVKDRRSGGRGLLQSQASIP
jgi:hypothetical protein